MESATLEQELAELGKSFIALSKRTFTSSVELDELFLQLKEKQDKIEDLKWSIIEAQQSLASKNIEVHENLNRLGMKFENSWALFINESTNYMHGKPLTVQGFLKWLLAGEGGNDEDLSNEEFELLLRHE